MATMLSKLDRDHRAELRTGVGEIRVVLHHKFHGIAHHHGLLAQTLTFFSTSSQSAQSDHVLPFETTGKLSTATRSGLVLEFGEELPIQTIMASRTSAIRDFVLQFAAYHPPPVESGARFCLRSTVLLI